MIQLNEASVADGKKIESYRDELDESLVQLARSGSQGAYSELCERYEKRIYRALLKITKNREDAEDALQDTLLKGYLHLNQFDGRAKFSTWLTRIAINCGLGLLRKKRRSRETPSQLWHDDNSAWHEWDVADIAANPEERCIEADILVRMREEIQKLPDSMRYILQLHHTEHCEISTLAATMGISLPAAKSRLLRARETITQAFI